MKIATRRKPKPQAGFGDEYCASLREYVEGGGEPALGRAYELGRRALSEQKTLVELVTLHHQAVLSLLWGTNSEKRREVLLRASAEYFAECLSPYEMAHRGFQDALNAMRNLNQTLEAEIKRIAYAVHDEAGQLLVAVHLALAEVVPELPEAQQVQVARIKELLNQVEKHLRRYSHELRPTMLDDLGWIPAIRFLAEGISKRANLPIHIDAAVCERLPGPIETTLYRIVQEALTNAVKHAKATNVWINAWKKNHMLFCSIRDDGHGFDSSLAHAAPTQKGLGLIAMQERVTAIGGTLHVESHPGRGAEISIRLPLEVDHANSHRTRR
jgi:signal transduction histidine kinase